MRALVTGVTGQDGWYLTERLQAEGATVIGMVRSENPTAVPPGVETVLGDMRDDASLRAAVAAADPDEVYNLASLSSVGLSWEQPVAVAEVNGVGVLRLLLAVRDHGERTKRPVRLVQAASAEIFGAAPAPHDETTPLAPRTPYGAAKAYAQHVVRTYRAAGVWAASAILYNHESPRRPDTFVTRKITRTVAAIAAGRADRLVVGNLDARRDWGYAADYADALVRIGRHERPDDFVVATGVSHSIADFVRLAFAHAGIEDWRSYLETDPALQRANDVEDQRGDPAKARRELGWTPTLDLAGLVALMVDADRVALPS
ncbi:MAG: GDP-mannose 4,6-dehydratase [Jatrophihabitans sp.]|uniref:GDP-mannose 4,6-dehydratase n=1 Tax=Jatrophihabitans sp. TaxID=1932789 RepID=UPI003F805A14